MKKRILALLLLSSVASAQVTQKLGTAATNYFVMVDSITMALGKTSIASPTIYRSNFATSAQITGFTWTEIDSTNMKGVYSCWFPVATFPIAGEYVVVVTSPTCLDQRKTFTVVTNTEADVLAQVQLSSTAATPTITGAITTAQGNIQGYIQVSSNAVAANDNANKNTIVNAVNVSSPATVLAVNNNTDTRVNLASNTIVSNDNTNKATVISAVTISSPACYNAVNASISAAQTALNSAITISSPACYNAVNAAIASAQTALNSAVTISSAAGYNATNAAITAAQGAVQVFVQNSTQGVRMAINADKEGYKLSEASIFDIHEASNVSTAGGASAEEAAAAVWGAEIRTLTSGGTSGPSAFDFWVSSGKDPMMTAIANSSPAVTAVVTTAQSAIINRVDTASNTINTAISGARTEIIASVVASSGPPAAFIQDRVAVSSTSLGSAITGAQSAIQGYIANSTQAVALASGQEVVVSSVTDTVKYDFLAYRPPSSPLEGTWAWYIMQGGTRTVTASLSTAEKEETAGYVWAAATGSHTTAGSFGKKVGDLPLSGTGDWTVTQKANILEALSVSDSTPSTSLNEIKREIKRQR